MKIIGTKVHLDFNTQKSLTLNMKKIRTELHLIARLPKVEGNLGFFAFNDFLDSIDQPVDSAVRRLYEIG